MISDHLNLQEKKADYMERRIMERACSVYLRKKTRYEFYGFIDAVESFGIFIKAIDYPFSGLARLKRFNFKSDTLIVSFFISEIDVMPLSDIPQGIIYLKLFKSG